MARPDNAADIVELEVDDHSDAGEDEALLPSHDTATANLQSGVPHQHTPKRVIFSTNHIRLGNGIITTPRGISAIMCLAVHLWVMSGMVAVIPGMQMIEELVCQRYYRGSPQSDIHYGADDYDLLCKAEVVQSAMAYVGGITSLLDSIIGVVLAFPFGILADRARRPVYMLGALGQLMSVTWSLGIFYFSNIFPVELVLLGPLFSVVGGGLATAVAILFAVISDVHKPEDRANWYFFLSLAAQAGIFIGPPFASALMGAFSPWAPLMLSPIFTTAAGLVMLLVPETAQPKVLVKMTPRTHDSVYTGHDSHQHGHGEIDNLIPNSNKPDADDNDIDLWQQVRTKGWFSTIQAHFQRQLSEAISIFRELLRQRSVMLLLLVFMLAAPLGKGFGQTFVQYVSKRYHRTIEEVGYLFALRGGLTLVIMGGLLPIVSHWLSSSPSTSPRRKKLLSPFARDLLLAQFSALFSLLGFFGLNTPSYPILISSLAVESLGSGLLPLCRSMITNFTTPAHTSSLFTLISIVETLGGMPAGIVLAWLFSTGMKMGGSDDDDNGGEAGRTGSGAGNEIWYGLPFVYLGSCALAALIALLFVKPPPPAAAAVSSCLFPPDADGTAGATSSNGDAYRGEEIGHGTGSSGNLAHEGREA